MIVDMGLFTVGFSSPPSVDELILALETVIVWRRSPPSCIVEGLGDTQALGGHYGTAK
jgi:hypothetical protein